MENIKKENSILLKLFYLAATITFAYIIPRLASLTADLTIGYFKWLDPDNVFVWPYIHHLVQLLLALVVIILPFWKKSLDEWGFNINEREWSLKVTLKFCVYWVLFNTIGTLIFQILSGWPPIVRYPMNVRNIAGNLSFMFIMPGISEEVLFRALVTGILLRSWKGRINILGINLPYAGFIAAIIFTLAHIGFDIYPFKVTYIEPMQLIFAFGLGIFYAVMFDRTKSLLGPILVHNASDGLTHVMYYILTLIAG